MTHEARLAAAGIVLPGPFAPHPPLVGCVVVQGVARTSGALPRDPDGRIEPTGRLGAEVGLDAGVAAAGLAAANALALVRAEVGSLDAVVRALAMTVYVACAPDFADLPAVADGASRLLVDVFGEAGRHTRAAIGVAALPRGAPVEVELSVLVGG